MSPLSSPWNISGLRIPNRIVMAPMSTNRLDPKGRVTPELINFLARRASGGCGMILVESATVDAGRGGTGLNLRLDRDEVDAGLRDLIRQLHSLGTVVAAQLWHAGPRAHVEGDLPLSPSGTLPGFPVSRALEIKEIEGIVRSFINAGYRAVNYGFDAVEVHAAHGYLLHHFIDKTTNRRRDAYGGSVAGRYRILKEICSGFKARHPGFPLLLRISLPGDDDFPAVAEVIRQAGYDAVDVRTGFSSMPATGTTGPVPAGYTLPLVRKLRPHLGLPILTGGRILTPEQAEQAIAEAFVAGVVLGRPLLADPDWTRKAIGGQAVTPCFYDCQPSCYSKFKAGEKLHCVYYGREG